MNKNVIGHEQDFDMVYEVRTTTKDIDIIASCIAMRKLLNLGWEVADLNNLVPFFSIRLVSGDIIDRYSTMGPLSFLKSELTNAHKEPRLLFYRLDKRYDAYGREANNPQLRCRYAESKIPYNLASLILKILNKQSKFVPIDYLVLNPEGYLFVELKANKAELSKKQLEVSKMIQDAGYKVLLLHVSLNLGPKARLDLSYIN